MSHQAAVTHVRSIVTSMVPTKTPVFVKAPEVKPIETKHIDLPSSNDRLANYIASRKRLIEQS